MKQECNAQMLSWFMIDALTANINQKVKYYCECHLINWNQKQEQLLTYIIPCTLRCCEWQFSWNSWQPVGMLQLYNFIRVLYILMLILASLFASSKLSYVLRMHVFGKHYCYTTGPVVVFCLLPETSVFCHSLILFSMDIKTTVIKMIM